MKIAFILFDGVTFLDFAGFYDVIYRLGQFENGKNLSWDICAASKEVTDEFGFTVKAGKVLPELSS
ncbi:MAG TPA: thiamine biosynthesis protein ThiJ, partial [Paenibacillus sp.]|nr:thiamine biosynthesis protein ThiJ [Paenibacillus sp.]